MPVNQATPRLGSLTSFFVAPLSVFLRPSKRLDMPDCLISFGSNLGDRLACLSQAVGLLKAVPGVERVRVSQPLETVPVGGPSNQPAYMNAALRCTTTLSAVELHQQLLSIETSLGRVRVERWGSRTADLDLLLYDQQQMASESLTIPHPRMACRRFVLQPSSEIAGEMKHPLCGCTVEQLLMHLDHRDNRIVVASLLPSPGPAWFDSLAHLLEKRQVQLVGQDQDKTAKLEGHQWQVIWSDWPNAHDALETAKLLVQLKPSGGIAAGIDFSGPRLLLSQSDPTSVRREIAAAIEGMLPLSLGGQ